MIDGPTKFVLNTMLVFEIIAGVNMIMALFIGMCNIVTILVNCQV